VETARRGNRPDIDIDTAKFLLYGLEGIEGWGIDANLGRLFLYLNEYQRQSKIYGNLFEIGVHHGRSAVLLALMSSLGETAVFVDLFDRQDENVDYSGSGNLQIFTSNLAKWAPGKATLILQENSLDLDFFAVEELKEGVRFAHIDGAHYRAAVLNDILKTRSVLLDGGIVVVDDFMHTGFPGVNEACNAYLEEPTEERLAPVAIGRNKLILTTKECRADLFAHLESGYGDVHRIVSFHDHDVICLDPH
jgi:Methyltransferase domain